MAGTHDAGTPVQRRTEEVASTDVDVTYVDAHPHLDLVQGTPILSLQAALGSLGGRHRRSNSWEGSQEPVAGVLERCSAGRPDGGPKDLVMTAEGSPHGVGMHVPQPG